jgi:hypothetical protein
MRTQELGQEGSSVVPNGGNSAMEETLENEGLAKVHNFLWKLAKNGLPTNVNRSYKHIANDESCEMCHHWKED